MFLEPVGQTSQHLLNHVRQKVLTAPASPKLRALQYVLQCGSDCLPWYSEGDSDIDFCNRCGWRILGHRKPPGRAFYITFRVPTVAERGGRPEQPALAIPDSEYCRERGIESARTSIPNR